MAYREFRDAAGESWAVWDTYPQPAHRGSMVALRDGWLTFERGNERRRLVPAPVGWIEEPDERLRHWLGIAERARPRLEEYAALPGGVASDRTDEHRGQRDVVETPRLMDDVRHLIERSRKTLNDLDRAIEAQSGPIGDPPASSDRRRR